MPPKKLFDMTVFIVDCSKDAKERLELCNKICMSKHFQQTKTLTRDLQRIMFVNGPDENYSAILNEWSSYSINLVDYKMYFDEKWDPLQVRPLQLDVLLDALTQAVNIFDDSLGNRNILVKKIVLISDLSTIVLDKSSANSNFIKNVKATLKDNNIFLYVLGLNNIQLPSIESDKDIRKLLKFEYLTQIKCVNQEQENSFTLLRQIAQRNVFALDVEHGFSIYMGFSPEKKQPYSWYVKLSIGGKLAIPVMTYKTSRTPKPIKLHIADKSEGSSSASWENAWFDLNTHERVPQEDVRRGFKFHRQFVSLTEEELARRAASKFPKGLSVIKFYSAKYFPKEFYFKGNNTHMIRPDMRQRFASDRSFKLFVAGMRKTNTVAIVKRVYNNNWTGKLFCVFPCPEHNSNNYLLMAKMPFAHHVRQPYVRGSSIPHVDTSDSELKNLTCGLLDAFATTNTDSGHPIQPLSSRMQFSANRRRQYEFFMHKALGENPGESPKLEPHPLLQQLAEEYVDILNNHIEMKEEPNK